MNGAQAEGCSPVASAFADGQDFCRPVKPDTIAKSLAIGNPADGPYALDLARRTGGGIDSVTDDEIRAGIKLLAETTGVFTETAGGVTTAVLAKLAERGEIDPDERVVLVITGEGLKTLDAVRGSFETHTIEPTLAAFEAGVPQTRRSLMAVVVKIPTQLRAAAGGEAETEVDGATVQEVLDGLFERHDELRARLYDDDGACGASSTSTSPAKTSASSTAWRRPSRTASDERFELILPVVWSRRAPKGAPRRELLERGYYWDAALTLVALREC